MKIWPPLTFSNTRKEQGSCWPFNHLSSINYQSFVGLLEPILCLILPTYKTARCLPCSAYQPTSSPTCWNSISSTAKKKGTIQVSLRWIACQRSKPIRLSYEWYAITVNYSFITETKACTSIQFTFYLSPRGD